MPVHHNPGAGVNILRFSILFISLPRFVKSAESIDGTISILCIKYFFFFSNCILSRVVIFFGHGFIAPATTP